VGIRSPNRTKLGISGTQSVAESPVVGNRGLSVLASSEF